MLFLSVLWMIVRVLLIAFGVLLALLLLLLSIRTGVEAVGVDGDISVEFRLGPLRIPIWPPPKHVRQTESPPAKKKSAAPKKPKQTRVFNREAFDLEEVLSLAMTLLGELSDSLRISRLRVRVVIGTDDAAATGMLLGTAAAAAGMLVPFLENTFEMKDYHVNVDADFEADHTKWAFTVFCSLRPIRAVFILLRHGKELYGLYKKLIRKEEAIYHE